MHVFWPQYMLGIFAVGSTVQYYATSRALQLHWDENYCRPAFDVLQLQDGEDEIIIGGGFDKDKTKDVATLAVDTWPLPTEQQSVMTMHFVVGNCEDPWMCMQSCSIPRPPGSKAYIPLAWQEVRPIHS